MDIANDLNVILITVILTMLNTVLIISLKINKYYLIVNLLRVYIYR